MSITITETNLHLIKSRLAYPSVDNIILTDDEIKDLLIRHALDEYFKKFPKTSEVSYSIGANSESQINFPDAYTFGAIDVRIVNKGYTSVSGGSFWDILLYQMVNGVNYRGYNAYGSKVRGYNPSGIRQMRFMNQMQNDSLVNQGTFKYRVNQDENKIYAYSSISAMLNITWAKWSENFSDVHFQFKWDVIELCQAYYFQYLADIGSFVTDSTQEVILNSEKLKEDSKEILDRIKEKWNDYQDMIVIRQ